MLIYLLLLLLLLSLFVFLKIKIENKKYFKVIYVLSSGLILGLFTGLRDQSVGVDTKQYIYRYNKLKFEFYSLKQLKNEGGYELFNEVLRILKINNQGFILVTSFIITISFVYFYYKYSYNLFLSIYLHTTIGLFTMSLSGIRQTLSICILLFSFDYVLKRNIIKFLLLIIIATTFHKSAIVFLPVYLIRNIKIDKKNGLILLIIVTTTLFLRKLLVPILEIITPEKYLGRYDLISKTNTANPILIIVALAIPSACLLFWDNIERMSNKELRVNSMLYTLSCINLFFNILSLNSSMIGRLSFYFIPFNMVLISNVIFKIRNKEIKSIAIIITILISGIYFFISTPGGVYNIDKFKFFWE